MRKKLLLACNNRSDAEGLAAAFHSLEEIELLPVVFDGRAAVETILTRDIDLLLLDLFLPEMDGLQVLDFISRLNDDRKPLIFITTALPDRKARFPAVRSFCFTASTSSTLSKNKSFSAAGTPNCRAVILPTD